jgi:hypothetical protein
MGATGVWIGYNCAVEPIDGLHVFRGNDLIRRTLQKDFAIFDSDDMIRISRRQVDVVQDHSNCEASVFLELLNQI